MANAATAKHAASSMILKLATSFLEDCVKVATDESSHSRVPRVGSYQPIAYLD